jgi:hypothetical protein
MTAAVRLLPKPEEARPDILAPERRSKLTPLLDRLAERKLSFRQLAHLSKALAFEHGQPEWSFKHVSVSHWFGGRRNPSSVHRQVIATLLQLPLTLVDDAFDSRKPLATTSLSGRPAIIYVTGTARPFEYPSTIRQDCDLSVPAIYEDEQWERIFSVYPANLKRHVNGSRAKLCGWVPDETFKPLIPYSLCLVVLRRTTTIPTLSDPEGFDKRIWFLVLPSGKVDVRFIYRDGAHLVTSKPNGAEQRLSKDAVDPLGYVTGTILFRLTLRVIKSSR